MRWLLQRGEHADDAPKLLTLDDASNDGSGATTGLTSLPGGALSITVRSAGEARDTLVELQRLQQELLTARARAAGDGVLSLGSNVKRQIQRPGRHLRRAGATAGRAARGFRPSAPASRARQASTTVFDGLDAALLVAHSAEGIDDALKLVGLAIEAVGGLVADIDLGDFNFD